MKNMVVSPDQDTIIWMKYFIATAFEAYNVRLVSAHILQEGGTPPDGRFRKCSVT